jgi:hypothetical protein
MDKLGKFYYSFFFIVYFISTIILFSLILTDQFDMKSPLILTFAALSAVGSIHTLINFILLYKTYVSKSIPNSK